MDDTADGDSSTRNDVNVGHWSKSPSRERSKRSLGSQIPEPEKYGARGRMNDQYRPAKIGYGARPQKSISQGGDMLAQASKLRETKRKYPIWNLRESAPNYPGQREGQHPPDNDRPQYKGPDVIPSVIRGTGSDYRNPGKRSKSDDVDFLRDRRNPVNIWDVQENIQKGDDKVHNACLEGAEGKISFSPGNEQGYTRHIHRLILNAIHPNNKVNKDDPSTEMLSMDADGYGKHRDAFQKWPVQRSYGLQNTMNGQAVAMSDASTSSKKSNKKGETPQAEGKKPPRDHGIRRHVAHNFELAVNPILKDKPVVPSAKAGNIWRHGAFAAKLREVVPTAKVPVTGLERDIDETNEQARRLTSTAGKLMKQPTDLPNGPAAIRAITIADFAHRFSDNPQGEDYNGYRESVRNNSSESPRM